MDKRIPTHVAIIMDGNRRWAKARGQKSVEGYNAGAITLKKLASHILDTGTKILSVFAFSTENFKRPKDEVDFLMNKFIKSFTEEFDFINKKRIKVLFSGRTDYLKKEVVESMRALEEKTSGNENGIFHICLNYGGKAEIVDATKKIIDAVGKGILQKEELTEEQFEQYLYQPLPPVDYLIRTSGEERLSNFMLWQISYAELYFSPLNFPDFDAKAYDEALEEYQNRTRKFGGDEK